MQPFWKYPSWNIPLGRFESTREEPQGSRGPSAQLIEINTPAAPPCLNTLKLNGGIDDFGFRQG